MPVLSARLSGTPIEKEYLRLEASLGRVEASGHPFDASLYPADVVSKVAREWQLRMVFEHRSSMVFAQLAQQLYEANAPLDMKIVMLRMAQDELRHAGTCADVIRALGGSPEPEAALEVVPLARHGERTAEERALRNVRYTTCLSEMVACARFVATIDVTRDPYLRDVQRALLADEVLHGQFGFHYLAWMQPWLDAHPGERASVERYLVHAFAILESELAPVGPFVSLTGAERALGANDPAAAREIFYATMEGAVVPGLERLGLAADASWRQRRRLA